MFDNLIQSTNDENFNNNLSSIKTSVLKNSIETPFTENQSFTLLCAVSKYLTSTYIENLLILDNATLSILEDVARMKYDGADF